MKPDREWRWWQITLVVGAAIAAGGLVAVLLWTAHPPNP